METTTEQLSLGSGPLTVWDADGSALVVHANADDFKTDPTGNSGSRIACGVLVKPPGR
jgi:Cu-Zn family superoxide dismutase